MEEISYVICNKERTKFYRSGEYYVESVFRATRDTQEHAQWLLDRKIFSSFQLDIFTEVVPVKFTAEILR